MPQEESHGQVYSVTKDSEALYLPKKDKQPSSPSLTSPPPFSLFSTSLLLLSSPFLCTFQTFSAIALLVLKSEDPDLNSSWHPSIDLLMAPLVLSTSFPVIMVRREKRREGERKGGGRIEGTGEGREGERRGGHREQRRRGMIERVGGERGRSERKKSSEAYFGFLSRLQPLE